MSKTFPPVVGVVVPATGAGVGAEPPFEIRIGTPVTFGPLPPVCCFTCEEPLHQAELLLRTGICNACHGDERARETLRLLSRFAVLWFMALKAHELAAIDGDTESWCLVAPWSDKTWRIVAAGVAVERGLLRVTWGQP